MGVCLELLGLTEQQKLFQTKLIDLNCQLSPGLSEGIWMTLNQLF